MKTRRVKILTTFFITLGFFYAVLFNIKSTASVLAVLCGDCGEWHCVPQPNTSPIWMRECACNITPIPTTWTETCNQTGNNGCYQTTGPCPSVTPTDAPERPTATPKPPNPSPTSRPSSTPGPTLTSVPNCPLKNKGDANCDCKIDEADFAVWKSEFIAAGGGAKTASFDLNDKVDLADYEIWRKYSASINMVEIECNGISLPPPTASVAPPPPSPSPVLTSPPTGEINYYNNFYSEASISQWEKRGEGEISDEEKYYMYSSNPDKTISFLICNDPLCINSAGLDYEVEVKAISDNVVNLDVNGLDNFTYGLVFDYLDGNNYSMFQILPQSQNFWVLAFKGGNRITNETHNSSVISKTQENTLKVKRQGNEITFLINNSVVFETETQTQIGQKVGLNSTQYDSYRLQRRWAAFDDFKLNSL